MERLSRQAESLSLHSSSSSGRDGSFDSKKNRNMEDDSSSSSSSSSSFPSSDTSSDTSSYEPFNEKNKYLCEYLLVVQHYYKINDSTSHACDALLYLMEWLWKVEYEVVRIKFLEGSMFHDFKIYLDEGGEEVFVNALEIFGDIRDIVPEDLSGARYGMLHVAVLKHLLYALEMGERSFVADTSVTEIYGMTPADQLQLWSEGIRTVKNIARIPDLEESTRVYLKYREETEYLVPREEIDILYEELKKYFSDQEFALVGQYRVGFSLCINVSIIATPPKALEIVHALGVTGYLAHGKLPWKTNFFDGVTLYEGTDDLLARPVHEHPLNGETVYRDVIKITHTGRAHEFVIRSVEKECWATALLLYTGNHSFNSYVRRRALATHHFIAPNYVLERNPIHPKSEEEIFSLFEMPYVPPREREWRMILQKDSEENRWGKVSREFLYHLVPAPPLPMEVPSKVKKGKKEKKKGKKGKTRGTK
jgi:DNA polymerase/3'-5' exonuclease PolX